MRQSVVLLHTQPSQPSHYDWLIDQPECTHEHRLLTFRTTSRPDEPATFQARHAPDHRAIYLTYQGPLSDNHGHVTQITSGEVLRWEQADTRISARIRWDNQTIEYTADRHANASIWTFQATPAQTP